MSGWRPVRWAAVVAALWFGGGGGGRALAVSGVERSPVVSSGGHSRGMCFLSGIERGGPPAPGQPPPPVGIIDPGGRCPTSAKHHPHLCLRANAAVLVTVPAQAKELDFTFTPPRRGGVGGQAAPTDASRLLWRFRAPGRRRLVGVLGLGVIYGDGSSFNWSLSICAHK
jgi:hypothetical protein